MNIFIGTGNADNKLNSLFKLVVFCSIILGFFIIVANTYATSYFVDYVSGSDDNSGLRKDTAFKHCPGDNQATNKAADVVLSPGDVIFFKGGTVYKGQIGLQWSGTEGKPIIYDGNTSASWGNGKAIIDGQNINHANAFNDASGARSYIVIKNFEIRDMGGYAQNNEPIGDCSESLSTAPSGTGIALNGSSHIEIENCYIHDIGNWLNRPPFSANAITGTGISLQDTSDILLDNIELTKMHTGISAKPKFGLLNSIEIRNCNLHDYFVWGIDIGVRSANRIIENISIHDNILSNMNYYDNCPDGWAGCGEKPHSDYIFLRNDYNGTLFDNIKIYNNKFTVTNGKCQAGTGIIYISNGPSASIYNNEFLNTSNALGDIVIDYNRPKKGIQKVKIMNNSFYGPGRCVCIRDGVDPQGNFVVKNNIFYRTTPYLLVTFYDNILTTGTMEFDYNVYYRPDGSSQLFYYNGGYGLTLADIQSYGYETHGFQADPKYKNPVTDLQLQADSPCLNAGTNLSSYFLTDKNGILRPVSGPWDIGAFEYPSENSPPSPPYPPKNVRIDQ